MPISMSYASTFLGAVQTRFFQVHAIPVARYLCRGSNGMETLRGEIEVENEGVRVPSAVRWLSGAPSVKARFNERIIKASSAVLAVPDEATHRPARKNGLRLHGGMTSRPTRRPGQTLFVATAADGAASRHSTPGLQ